MNEVKAYFYFNFLTRFWSLKHATALDNNLMLQVTNYILGVNEKTDFNTLKTKPKTNWIRKLPS